MICFVMRCFVSFFFWSDLDGVERASCFIIVVFLVPFWIPNAAMGLSVVCDCGIS